MLAHKFNEKLSYVKYPCYINPKYDGCRSITDGTKMWSRKGIIFPQETVQHLLNGFIAQDFILDGELILPHPFQLQDTMSAAKRLGENTHKLLYRIYDVMIDKPYSERYKVIKHIKSLNKNPNILITPLYTANDEDEVYEIQERMVEEKWEGSMIRIDGKGYEQNIRSNQLLKLKDWLEEEFEVVNVVEGKGKHQGCAILVCVTPEGREFNVTPKETLEERQKMFKNPHKIIGKEWIVRFQAYTKDKIPQFGRGICERDRNLQG
jgi:DNA ligase-1